MRCQKPVVVSFCLPSNPHRVLEFSCKVISNMSESSEDIFAEDATLRPTG